MATIGAALDEGRKCRKRPSLAVNRRSLLPRRSTAEDCLFLNLTVPGTLTEMSFWQNKPVLVFFHGGGFSGGSGDVYDGEGSKRHTRVVATA